MLYVPPTVKWTDERVAKLTELFSAGLSASQIASNLGGVTRNAVIGKIHRLGLTLDHLLTADEKADRMARRKEAQALRLQRQTVRRERQQRKHSPRSTLYQMFVKPVSDEQWRKEHSKEIDFLDLEPNHCRHPYNLEGPFKFCGCDKFSFQNREGVKVESSYCEHHHNTNTQPSRAPMPKARIYHGTNFSVWA